MVKQFLLLIPYLQKNFTWALVMFSLSITLLLEKAISNVRAIILDDMHIIRAIACFDIDQLLTYMWQNLTGTRDYFSKLNP